MLSLGCRTTQQSDTKDLFANDYFYWAQLDTFRGGTTPTIRRAQCDRPGAQTPDNCTKHGSWIHESQLTNFVISKLQSEIAALPSDEGVAKNGADALYKKDPNGPVLDKNNEAALQNYLQVFNSETPLLNRADAQIYLKKSSLQDLLDTIKGYQGIVDRANAALKIDPNDADAKSVRDQNIALMAPWTAKLPAAQNDVTQAQATRDAIAAKIDSAKKGSDDARTACEQARAGKLNEYVKTTDYAQALAARDQQKITLT